MLVRDTHGERPGGEEVEAMMAGGKYDEEEEEEERQIEAELKI